MFREFTRLLISTTIGLIWLFIAAPFLFSDIFPIQNIPSITSWVEQVYQVASIGILIVCTSCTLFWIFHSIRARFDRSKHARRNEVFWWILSIILFVLAYIIYLIVEGTYTSIQPGGTGGTVPYTPPYAWMGFVVLIDVLLLFWLPSALATMGTLRYVPPGSMTLRRLFGG